MYRYKLKNKQGEIKAQFELDVNTDTRWEQKAASGMVAGLKPERIVEADGNYDQADVLESYPEVVEGDVTVEPARVKLKAEYVIEIEDITQELAANESKKQKLDSAKNDLKQVRQLLVDAKAADTANKRDKVLVDMAKAILKISKALGLADADESEN
jgi:hypothetical protein